MPALKTEFTEQRPLSEWEGAADFYAQMEAAANDPVAQAALVAGVPEGFLWSHDEVNKVTEVTDDHADHIDALRDELDAHVADASVHGEGGGSPTPLTSQFSTNNSTTAAASALTHNLDARVTQNAQTASDAQTTATQGLAAANAAQSTANQAVTNIGAAQTSADNAQTDATQALSDAADAQGDATANRAALNVAGKTYTVPNNTVFAADEEPTPAEIKAWQLTNFPNIAEHTLFRYETVQNVLWLFAMDKDGTMHFLNKHDPGMEGGVYMVPVSSPDTLSSDVHANKLRHYQITATSPTVAVSTPSGDVQAVEFDVPLPLTSMDKFRVERQSTARIWLNGTFEGDSPIINLDKRSLMVTAKVDLSGWYWSVAG